MFIKILQEAFKKFVRSLLNVGEILVRRLLKFYKKFISSYDVHKKFIRGS
jgi:hypothetical protein